MSFKKKWKYLRSSNGLHWKLWWIDIRYGIEEWLLLKTWKFRLKHTKVLKLSSMAYNTATTTWDDVDVADQWGLWLPLGFGICSRLNWEFDNDVNRNIGQPEEPWRDVDGNDDWKTYYVKDEFLVSNHYIDSARRHLKDKLGDDIYEKDFELTLKLMSQKWIDDDQKMWEEMRGKPLKVAFTDQAKEDIKEMVGEEGAAEIFKDIEDRNKDIDNKTE